MADLRTTLADSPIAFDERQPLIWKRRQVNLVDLEDGANNVIDIPAEHALVAGYVVSRVTGASGGAATLDVVFNSANMCSQLSVADLTKGDVTSFDLDATLAGVYVTSDTAVSLTNGTAVYTAGQIDLYVGYLKVVDNT